MPNNQEFLTAIFGADAPWSHVTDFTYDPNNIPKDEHMKAWAGDYFCRYRFGDITNQYFTISTFYCDDEQKARRRKVLYRQTHCIVLDDVREKLSEEAAQKLPRPSWIMETSPGSFQWGYILSVPCNDRARIDNLNDGLIASELAPSGKDPGQRGVTRYVRLPDGYNTKASKMVNGQPFKCRMVTWEPFNTVTLEQLAEPFSVNLDTPRREQRVDGAAEVNDHPLIHIPDIIHIKEVRSDGRFDITCPWVDEHTGADDSGTAVFTNADGTLGFKCHHGACDSRTGAHLLGLIESRRPGFKSDLQKWQADRSFAAIIQANPMPSFIDPVSNQETSLQATSVPSVPDQVVPEKERRVESAQVALTALRREIPGSIEQRDMAGQFLRAVDGFSEIDRVHWHQQLRDAMRWNTKEFNSVLNHLRSEWYAEEHKDDSFFDNLVYIGEIDQFFDRRKRIFYTPAAFQNNFSHLDSEARKQALEGKITKVDKLDYAPKKPAVFERTGVTFANSWQAFDEPQGLAGDVSRWFNHWDALGWAEYRDHMLQWMAWTILHPETKINHMLLLGGGEGIGKDFLLYPLIKAMEGHQITIPGEALTSQFSQYLLSTKYVHINEVSLSDYREASSIAEKLKPLAAAPPDQLYINRKGVAEITISNLVNCTMGTNSTLPFKTSGLSRRIYGAWSDLNIRGIDQQVLPEWRTYWSDRWTWMKGEGVQNCIYYLRNCVDLSSFNPFEAPPITQYVRDINESSKPLLMQCVEATMTSSSGIFQHDICTSLEACNAIRNLDTFDPRFAYLDTRTVTPSKIMNTMTNIHSVGRRDIPNQDGSEVVKYWIVRNHERYKSMTNEEFLQCYNMQKFNTQQGLQAVK